MFSANRAESGTGFWLVTDSEWVDVVANDAVVARIKDPQHYIENHCGARIVIDDPLAKAYQVLECPNPPNWAPIDAIGVVVIDLVTEAVRGVVTDPQHLLPVPSGTSGGTTPIREAYGAALSADGARLYVTSLDNAIAIVDTSSDEVVGVIGLPATLGEPDPSGGHVVATPLAISPDGTRAFVEVWEVTPEPGSISRGYISVVDLPSRTVTATITTNSFGADSAGHRLLLSPDGTRLYVIVDSASPGTPSELVMIDTTTLQPVPVSGIQAPAAMTATGSTLYVVEPGGQCTGQIDVLNISTGSAQATIPIPSSALTSALGVNLDGSEVYVGYLQTQPTPPCDLSTNPPSFHMGIVDTATNTMNSEVASNGIMEYSQYAVDPYLGALGACEAGKRKLVGRYITATTTCLARARLSGAVPDASCLQKALDKFAGFFGKIADRCHGDATAVEGVANACIEVLAQDVPTAGKCSSLSLKSIAKAAGGLLNCAAVDIKKVGSLAACSAKQMAKLNLLLQAAGSCTSGSISSDLDVECVGPLIAALPR